MSFPQAAPQTEPSSQPILRQLDYANALTLLGLLLGFLSAIAAIQSHFYLALISFMFAGVVDLIDGSVARRISRTPLQSAVGEQLDGLADLCSFGFSPTIFAYCFGLQTPVNCLILMLYLGAAGLRTAYFSCTGLTGTDAKQSYIGLPTAYSAVFLPLTCLTQFVLPLGSVLTLLAIIFLLHTIAMVTPFRVPKPQGIWQIPFFLGTIVLSGFYGWAIVSSQ
jgi:CDP-diacylglycerol---serine O-phosphatidyltransferase